MCAHACVCARVRQLERLRVAFDFSTPPPPLSLCSAPSLSRARSLNRNAGFFCCRNAGFPRIPRRSLLDSSIRVFLEYQDRKSFAEFVNQIAAGGRERERESERARVRGERRERERERASEREREREVY